MNKAIIYIHGKGGDASEADFYKDIFKDYDVIGIDYKSQTPWEAKEEFPQLFEEYFKKYDSIIIIANSIGAYFTMSSINNSKIEKAFFISPIVNMQKLIEDMMTWAKVSEDELKEKGEIETSFGETLSWNYYSYVKDNSINWNTPTYILYGAKDNLTSLETIKDFANEHNATLTIMENGEHWFHTDEQMDFLEKWLTSYLQLC